MLSILLSLFLQVFAYAGMSSPCDYYQQKSLTLNCSSENYLTAVGYRYCQAFVDREFLFEEKTKHTLAFLRQCLITELEKSPGVSCQTAESIAADNHLYCYHVSDFCDLKESEKFKIFWIIKPLLRQKIFRDLFQSVAIECANSLHFPANEL